MVLMSKNIKPDDVKARPKRTLQISVEEMPQRPVYTLKSQKARHKLITTCEKFIRSSMEYRDYMKFLKDHMNYNRCAVLNNVVQGNGKKYSIEIHHEPFTLYDLVDIEITRREVVGEPIEVLKIAESVMELHYEGLVGLIPLTKTAHEMIDSYKTFIPLQHIYQDYHKYYEEFEEYIDICEHIKKKIEVKVKLSMQCDKIQSDIAPEFVYVDVDGFDFPKIPDEWKDTVATTRNELAKVEEAEAKEAKKKETKKEVKTD
jgi:hypothetical protein